MVQSIMGSDYLFMGTKLAFRCLRGVLRGILRHSLWYDPLDDFFSHNALGNGVSCSSLS